MPGCCLCTKKLVGGNGPFFRIPKDDRRRSKWSETCRMQFSSRDRICVDHFQSSDIITRAERYGLMPNAVPCVQILLEENESVSRTEFPLDDVSSLNMNLDMPMEIPFAVPIRVQYKDSQTQTDPAVLERTMQSEEKHYKTMYMKLLVENRDLNCKLAEANTIVTSMRTLFTEGQIWKLISGGNVQWKWNDISHSICLHASGPRAYNHLYNKGFPLPHVSTLQRWARKVNVREGFLSISADLMRQCTELTSDDRVCVIAFDEMKVAETYEYDAVEDYIRKPANYVQVVIARGLRKSWKLPVFYNFECQVKKDILFSIIRELNDAGFPVVAMVCDMGPTNRKLWKDLGVTSDKPWFQNPVKPDDKVFTFADAPHLLKLIRNHFLDTGLLVNNELLTSRTIVDTMKHTSVSDVSITYKLTNEHLSVKGVGRQKVKLAAQLLSNSTANAIRRCHSLGMNIYKPIETSNFIQLVNDWFDILNSTINNFSYPGKEPFGMALVDQQWTLRCMNELMSSPLIPNKKTLEWFQKGVIMTNNALEMPLDFVKQKCNMTYILTNRLNQDVIEHFFGTMRSKGGLYDHPSPKEFQYRLRKYILARNTEILRGTGNSAWNSTQWLGSSNTLATNNGSNEQVLHESNAVCNDDVL